MLETKARRNLTHHPWARSYGRTREEHGPANDGDEEVGGLGDELEIAVQVEQRIDVLWWLAIKREAAMLMDSR